MIPKTEIKRIRTRLIVFMFAVMFTAHLVGCSKPPKFIPEELSGKYNATHPEYEGEFFVLNPGLITLGFGDGKYKFYKVMRVEKEMIDNRMLYTILCCNEDEGEEFNFAFFTDFAGKEIIHFKNKPHVDWEKQKTKIFYNDNSDT